MDDDSYAKWKEIGVEDLKSYFGFILLMGLNYLHVTICFSITLCFILPCVYVMLNMQKLIQ